LILGVLPALAAGPVALAATAVTGAASTVTFVRWHGFNTTLVLSMLTLAGAMGLFALRSRLCRLNWPAVLHAERLYSFTVAILDILSRRIAPALQSASLRSYVLIVVATAIAWVTVALAADGALPPLRRWTPVAFHEGLLAALIVAGALTAAFARTRMAAVLSLGTLAMEWRCSMHSSARRISR
jgi:hypothetical protein